MNIGQAAKLSGVSAKMIRYYESIKLIPEAERTQAGYRSYTSNDVHALQFIRRARDLGFTVEKMMELLALWRDRTRASADVKQIALGHVRELNRKARELQEMSRTLKYLADNCQGDMRPKCPIIDSLAEPDERASSPTGGPRFGAAGVEPDRAKRASAPERRLGSRDNQTVMSHDTGLRRSERV